MKKRGAAQSISPFLFGSLKRLYWYELRDCLASSRIENGLNGFTVDAIAAFPLAVSVWESVINEQFLNGLVKHDYPDNKLFRIGNKIERWSVTEKTELFPLFIFDKQMQKGSRPFQDLQHILNIRNAVVHFMPGMRENAKLESAINTLREREFTVSLPKGTASSWQYELSSTECIRYCINTLSQLVQELSNLETEFYKTNCIPIIPIVFSPINISEVQTVFKEYGVEVSM